MLPGRLPSSLDPACRQAGIPANDFLFWSSSAESRTGITSEPPPRASARREECSSASVTPSASLAAPLRARRAMRRIDECRLTSSYQHPRLVGFRRRLGSRPADPERSPAFTAGPFASAGRTFPSVSTAAGVVFPSWRVRTEPLTPLSPPPQGLVALARPRNPRRPPRPSRLPPRERGRPGIDPGCLPSIEDLRPATLSRAPGSGLR
jgi:hypothetical protein